MFTSGADPTSGSSNFIGSPAPAGFRGRTLAEMLGNEVSENAGLMG